MFVKKKGLILAPCIKINSGPQRWFIVLCVIEHNNHDSA